MKIYICGPMSGLPDFNYPAFHVEAARLRALGYEVINTAENVIPGDAFWLDYMRVAITQLVHCDCVRLLHGWEHSRGAKIERQIAADLGLRVVYPDDDIEFRSRSNVGGTRTISGRESDNSAPHSFRSAFASG